ncbi:protein phosphatase 2C domain-containing protein [Alicyclobacillus tolerans]|uniref:protein phosphatase 2C domain-containing protein n=1 Tax=Alicyclobacillus tolerans TaxID=90970 RepID=UPI001F398CFA|nr:protein phosphatase 2C domain-containing protein [Alicyclobacillus tolerans]MCF8566688.1 protein phosphatase 2C domain-containing protein [Alicyclobacillus tolerans]
MHVECVTNQGSRVVNEDSFYVGDRIAVVIDGASGLSPNSHFAGAGVSGVSSGPEDSLEASTDAHWFARSIVRHLPAALHGGLDLSAAMQHTLAAVRDSVSHIDFRALQAFEQPSAAVAVVRWNAREVEYLAMGDCFIALQNGEGPVEVVTDDRIARFDALAIDAVTSLQREESLTLTEAKQRVLPILQANRSKMNQPNGYPILSLDGQGLADAKTGVYARGDFETKVLLCSDGFARTVDVFQVQTWEQLLRPEVGLHGVLQDLRRMEQGDAQCSEFPRLKAHDDATAVLITLP